MVNLDQFRQTARIAAAQSMCVINAGYVYDAALIQKLEDVFPLFPLLMIDSSSLTHSFEYLTLAEQDEVSAFVELANKVLEPFKCYVEVRRFAPDELPALHIAGSDVEFKRSIELTKEVTDSFWSSLLDEVGEGLDEDALAQLCFNYRNPVVYKITRMRDEDLLRLSVQMLYVQAILLSHRPLNAKEMALLNEGLLRFIEWGADAMEGWIQ
jgi:molecular chaperone HtpG